MLDASVAEEEPEQPAAEAATAALVLLYALCLTPCDAHWSNWVLVSWSVR